MEPPYNDVIAFAVLFVFVLFNQAYFMGLLFLVSGYFSPGSLDRKGTKQFVRDRLVRLGIPLIVFFFVLSPLAFLGLYAMPSSLTGITTPPSWQDYPSMLGIGPMWFVEMLLIFDIGFAIWWVMRKKRNSVHEAPAKDQSPEQGTGSEPPHYQTL